MRTNHSESIRFLWLLYRSLHRSFVSSFANHPTISYTCNNIYIELARDLRVSVWDTVIFCRIWFSMYLINTIKLKFKSWYPNENLCWGHAIIVTSQLNSLIMLNTAPFFTHLPIIPQCDKSRVLVCLQENLWEDYNICTRIFYKKNEECPCHSFPSQTTYFLR